MSAFHRWRDALDRLIVNMTGESVEQTPPGVAVQVWLDGRWQTERVRHADRAAANAAAFEHRCNGTAARVREFLS